MIDILKEIELGKISLSKGEELLTNSIDAYHNRTITIDWWQNIGFDKYEATAYAQGGSLADLLILRFHGWPNKCIKCGQLIDYRNFGWWLIHVENSIPLLRHITCPNIDVTNV